MIDYNSISILFKLEILSQNEYISIENRKELNRLADEISTLVSSKNPIKAIKIIGKYKELESEILFKFKKFGGNTDLMNKRLRDYETKAIPLMRDIEKIKNKIMVKKCSEMIKNQN